MQHPDEGTIHTWIDGALDAEGARELEAHVATCADCARVVAEARGLVAASSRILTALDNVPVNVLPASGTIARKPQRVTRPWATPFWMRTAAAVLIVAGTSALVVTGKLNTPEAKRADVAMSTESDLSQVRPQAEMPPAAPAPAAPASRDVAANSTSATSVAGTGADARPLTARGETAPAPVRRQAVASVPTVGTTEVAKEVKRADAAEERVAATIREYQEKKAESADRLSAAAPATVSSPDQSPRIVGSAAGVLSGAQTSAGAGKSSISRDLGSTRASAPSAAQAISQRAASPPVAAADETVLQRGDLVRRAAAATGCYALALSPWSGGTIPFGAPPAQIELDSLTSVQESIRGLNLVHPAPGAASNGAPLAYWRVIGDSVAITWRDNVRGVTMTLPVDGEVVQGRARTFSSSARDGATQTAQVDARRISCRR